MRWFAAITLAGLISLTGCVSPAPTRAAPPAAAKRAKSSGISAAREPLVSPDSSPRGKVSRYNEAGRFMVLEFPAARLPVIGQALLVYRNGLQVGEAKVTGPQRDDRTVADLIHGEAQVGDDVRAQ